MPPSKYIRQSTFVKECSNSNASYYANSYSENDMYPPDLSKPNKGNAYFAPIVNTGWNRYIGSVFLPTNPIARKTFLLPMLCINLGVKERKDNANTATAKNCQCL